MKTVFIGSGDFGFAGCGALLEQRLELTGIVTLPKIASFSLPKPISVANARLPDFQRLAQKVGCPLYEATTLHTLEATLRELKPDLIFVLGWYSKISPQVLAIPPRGVIAVHASLLPKYRGGAPLVWAIINGESEAGVTLFYMSEEIDAGDIIAQGKFAIDQDDYIGHVLQKAKKAALRLLEEQLPHIRDGDATRVPQDHDQASYFPMRAPQDGKIDWSWDCARIRNFIRAQARPYPGAFTEVGDKRVIIWDAEIVKIT